MILRKYLNFSLIYAILTIAGGIIQVLNIYLSSAANASISGIAGIGHILSGSGLVLLLVTLKKMA
ncbi:MAG: DUF2871 family protein [Lachnospiraceae bacterium]